MACQHAGVSNGYMVGRTDSDPGRNKDMIPYRNSFDIFSIRPHRQPGLFISASQKGNIIPDADRSAKYFNMPGLYDEGIFAKGYQLRGKPVADIQMQKSVPCVFYIIGSIIFYQLTRSL